MPPISELKLQLISAPDDAPLSSPAYQKELSTFAKALRDDGVQIQSRLFAFDAVDGGGGLSGEFIVELNYLAPILVAALGAWLHYKRGRKVRVKFGDVEAEGSSVGEVEQLLRLERNKESKQPHVGDSVSISGVEKKIAYVGWSDGIVELEGMPKRPIPISDLQSSNDGKNLWIFTGHTPRE